MWTSFYHGLLFQLSWKYSRYRGFSFKHVCGLALIRDLAQCFNSNQAIGQNVPAHTHFSSAKFFSTSLLIVSFNYWCLLNTHFSQNSWQPIKQHWGRHHTTVFRLTSALTQFLESTLVDMESLNGPYRLHPAVSGNFFSLNSLLIYQIYGQQKRFGILWNQSIWR